MYGVKIGTPPMAPEFSGAIGGGGWICRSFLRSCAGWLGNGQHTPPVTVSERQGSDSLDPDFRNDNRGIKMRPDVLSEYIPRHAGEHDGESRKTIMAGLHPSLLPEGGY